MPSEKNIKESMLKYNISDEIIEQFDLTPKKGSNPEPMMEIMSKMDNLLSHEQCLLIMGEQGCCKGGKRDKDCKAFAKEHAEKTIEEKLKLFCTVEYMMSPVINNDGTFTITMSGYQNGVHTGKTTCSCGMIKKLKQPFSVSSTYCGCCAGHFRYHYQTMLGVPIKLKEIISSPLNTNCEQPCKFLFEIQHKPTLDELIQYIPKQHLQIAEMFISLAKEYNLKEQIKYIKPYFIDLNENKGYRCVFFKNKHVVFTLDFSPSHFTVKANLNNIDSYLHDMNVSEDIINSLQNKNWDCAKYNGGTCNDKCRGGIPVTINGKTEYKCIGGAFTFNELSDNDWIQVLELTKKELSL